MTLLKRLLATTVLAAMAGAAGCATESTSGGVYAPRQARQEQSVRTGIVDSVRRVTIEGTQGSVGAMAGGAVGGIAGSNVGGGRAQSIGSILGAVAGGVAGSAIERRVTEKNGIEITVRLDSGELRAITQDADEEFKPGERVRLLSGGGTTRVTH